MVRNILGVLAGVVVGSIVNMGIVMISVLIFPPPEGITLNDSESFAAYVETLPPAAFGLALLAHAGGTFVGAATAAWIAKTGKLVCAMIIGGWFLIGGAVNLTMTPHPLWFGPVDLIVCYLPAAYLGYLCCRGKPVEAATPDVAEAG